MLVTIWFDSAFLGTAVTTITKIAAKNLVTIIRSDYHCYINYSQEIIA